MLRTLALVLSAAALAAVALPHTTAQEKKGGPIELRLVANKATYTFDGGGRTPAEYKKMLEDIVANEKKKPGGFGEKRPPAPQVDLTLKIVNVSKDDQTVNVGGDPNVYTFELKGPGVLAMRNNIAFTADFRLPKSVTLKPGQSYDIPVKSLMDGMRGASRLVYWTEPGEYTLSATYSLSGPQGEKGTLLRSEPVKITVEKK